MTSAPSGGRQRVLVFIVAYNAGKTIQDVVRRIPRSLSEYDTEILIIDDSSRDETFAKAHILEQQGNQPFPLTALFNPVNQGYGGNQKIGFHYVIEKGFDYVALVHGMGSTLRKGCLSCCSPCLRGRRMLFLVRE